jgi:hypothetical protein
MKNNYTYKSVGVMTTRLGPSAKYVRLGKRSKNTEVIKVLRKNKLLSRFLSNECWGLSEEIILIILLILSKA